MKTARLNKTDRGQGNTEGRFENTQKGLRQPSPQAQPSRDITLATEKGKDRLVKKRADQDQTGRNEARAETEPDAGRWILPSCRR
jgi:hypothetical protein